MDATRLLDGLRRRGWRLAVAESCTGGLLAARLTDVPGAGDAFVGGVVSYVDRVKAEHLGVPHRLLAERGAVCEPVARAMADGVRARFGADLALSVTGFAGPDAPEGQPVGLVFVGCAGPEGDTRVVRHVFDGDRRAVREQSVDAALRLALDALGADRTEPKA